MKATASMRAVTGGPEEEKFDWDIVMDTRTFRAEQNFDYGYLQIFQYRSRKMNKAALLKHWVSLPAGAHVHRYSCSSTGHSIGAQSWKAAAGPLRSCLRQGHGCKVADYDALSTTSTSASTRHDRHVRFADEVLPGHWDEANFLGEADELDEYSELSPPLSQSLAEWIFIDRDICGISLHQEFDSDCDIPELMEFTSSPYAPAFFEELREMELFNAIGQHIVQSEEDRLSSQIEERELDEALLAAGVHESSIYVPPEDIYEQRTIQIEV
jgi:hypothetical protein